MRIAKVLLTIAAISAAIMSAMFVLFDEQIISNIGVGFTKAYTILFMLLSITLTKEVMSINIEENEE